MLARTPAALKKRRYRRRLRDGVIALSVEQRAAIGGRPSFLIGRGLVLRADAKVEPRLPAEGVVRRPKGQNLNVISVKSVV